MFSISCSLLVWLLVYFGRVSKVLKHPRVTVDFPLADALVIRLPFSALVPDEFVAQLAAEHAFDKRVGFKRVDGFTERARQFLDPGFGELGWRQFIKVFVMRI